MKNRNRKVTKPQNRKRKIDTFLINQSLSTRSMYTDNLLNLIKKLRNKKNHKKNERER